MKKCLALVMCCLFAATTVNAQSKVFKEVNDEISSEIKTIFQDDALVGYLVFTQLEKSSEDSFNYRITIMDENLNDIGKVNFKEQQLDLQGVAFDQDVLCLGYFKTFSVPGAKKKKLENKYSVLTQFLSLQGKVLKTNTYPAEIKSNSENVVYTYDNKGSKKTYVLNNHIQVKNIPQQGFACFYGDDNSNSLIAYNDKGVQLWKKKIAEAKGGFIMLAAKNAIHLLEKQKVDDTPEGGYEVLGFSVSDSAAFEKLTLKDKKGNYLKVLNFANDPATGKPYIAGNIINPGMSMKYQKARHIAKGAYSGVFTININGPNKSDVQEMYSYWGDGSMNPAITEKGYYTEQEAYAKYYDAVRDFNGNTYFVGSSFIKKPRIGSIISGVVLAPLLIPPMLLAVAGTSKCKITDAIVLKQTSKGAISIDQTIPSNNSSFFVSKMPLSQFDNRTFYSVTNNDTKTNYIIVNDVKDIVIYNLNQQKVVRTVPHKEGKTITNIFPAKEGHVMVAESNKKEKYSKLSIEAI